MSSTEGAPQEPQNNGAPTPTLNNLLNKGSDGGGPPNQEPTLNGSAAAATTSRSQEWPPRQAGDGQPQQMGQPGMAHGFPQGAPGYAPHPQYMGRPGPPHGYPQYPGGYPGGPGVPPGYQQYPPHMMRQGVPPNGEFVRMPPGPNPLEWAAQQRKMAEGHGPGTPGSMPAPSPAASSIPDEGPDDRNRLDSPSWPNQRPPQMAPHHGMAPQHMGMPPQGMPLQGMPGQGMPGQGMPQMHGHPHPGMHPGMMHPGQPPMMHPPMNPPAPPPRKETILDKLVGPPNDLNPARVMPERRAFFERLLTFCEQNGEPITVVPQVSKQNVDLHRLYIAVRNKGGFEAVTKNKEWKNVCTEANRDLSESSAAGYQLRKHYQKHLLVLECVETGKNPEDAVAFADKLKRQRPKKEPATPAAPPAATTPQPQAVTAPPSNQGPTSQQSPASFTGASTPGSYPPPAGPGGDAAFYQQPPGGSGVPPGMPQYGYMNGSHGGPPPGAYPPRMPSAGTPMRAPHPQMLGQPGAASDDGNLLQVPGQPATPGSQAGPASVQPATPQALQSEPLGVNSQAGSRAPSTGPPASAATPDSTSRMSAGAEGPVGSVEGRPGSAAAATPGAPATPAGMSTSSHMQQPSTSMAGLQPGQPQPGMPPPGSYYGQPGPMYPNGPRPGHPAYHPGYAPPHGYHPGHPGAGIPAGYPGGPPPHPAAHPQHPQHQQYLQQQHQIWQQQQQQRGYPPQQHPGMNRGYPGYPPSARLPPPQGPPQGAPSPGASKMRFQPQPSPASAPSPFPPAQRPAIPSTSQPTPQPAPTVQPPSSSINAATNYNHVHTFPPGSIEASTISQRRRRKLFARDIHNATPRRLIMALRSGIEMEAIWAFNALNVLLYDDTNPHPSLTHMPGLLNVLVEHFWATLSVLFPNAFSLAEPTRFLGAEPEVDEEISRLMEGKLDIAKLPVVSRTAEKSADYSNVSRTGRKIHLKQAEIPVHLKKQLHIDRPEPDYTLSTAYVEERLSLGLGGGLAERIAARLKAEWDASILASKPKFSNRCKDTVPTIPAEIISVKAEDDQKENTEIYLSRRATETDLSDSLNSFEFKWPKSTALTNKDEVLHRMAMRALSLSNILRGFAWLPGNEHILCKHNGLLYIIGRFLSLLSEEKPMTRPTTAVKIDINAPLPEPEPYEVTRMKAISLLDPDDGNVLLLVDSMNQLRDDAFVILTHMSVSLDLFDLDGALSFPIYDGLLRWSVSSVPEATDPIPPAAVSPRNYCLEIMCKMSVLERNVDMFLSTGAWPRVEKLTHILSKMLNMSEEIQNREFAIVILNALCLASEAVCYIAALETSAVTNLIAFIESSDHNMHQVMQTHGMPALRDNPEMMGTSVGMLRRAATMLKLLVKAPNAHRIYQKYQQRLLSFTMSQLMDSRVAGMIADTLFEIQAPLAIEESTLQSSNKEDGRSEDGAVIKDEPDDALSEVSLETTQSEKSRMNGKPSVNAVIERTAVKRSCPSDNSPPSKRNCLENGYEKKNGQIDGSALKLQDSRSENGSMAVVA